MKHVKEDTIGGACSRYGKKSEHIGFWHENLEERNYKENIVVDGKIILKWTLEK
jgi:hypothetical protein